MNQSFCSTHSTHSMIIFFAHCYLYERQPKINTDITTTQIALNYVVTKGGVPLVEVNNPKQAQEVIGCLGWTLTDAEVDMLELAADACRS